MEKVKITQGLATLIETTKKKFENHEIIEKHTQIPMITNKELDLDTLIRALYIGYEVEPQFEIGDYLYNESSEIVFVLRKRDKKAANNPHNKKHLRHATPEEKAAEKTRIFFAKNGREPWELKRYDNLSTGEDGSTSHTVWKTNDDGVEFNEFGIFKSWVEIKKEFKVSCFAQDRKDI